MPLWPPQFVDAEDGLTVGLGYLAQTFPRNNANATALVLTTQRVQAGSIGLKAGMVLTGAVICVTGAAAAGATYSAIGLYNSSDALVAVTANTAEHFASAGSIKLAFTATYTVPTTGIYYIAALTVNAGTNPSVLRGSGLAGTDTATSGAEVSHWQQATQSTLPSTATPAATTPCIWGAVY